MMIYYYDFVSPTSSTDWLIDVFARNLFVISNIIRTYRFYVDTTRSTGHETKEEKWKEITHYRILCVYESMSFVSCRELSIETIKYIYTYRLCVCALQRRKSTLQMTLTGLPDVACSGRHQHFDFRWTFSFEMAHCQRYFFFSVGALTETGFSLAHVNSSGVHCANRWMVSNVLCWLKAIVRIVNAINTNKWHAVGSSQTELNGGTRSADNLDHKYQ